MKNYDPVSIRNIWDQTFSVRVKWANPVQYGPNLTDHVTRQNKNKKQKNKMLMTGSQHLISLKAIFF